MFFVQNSKTYSIEVLASITTATTQGRKPDWRKSIESLPRLNLNRCALFLTGLEKDERQECYRLLQAVKRHFPFSLPFVHARNEMREEEFRFLRHEFGTERFNIHPVRCFPLGENLKPGIRSSIYVENTKALEPGDVDGFAGTCLDVAHLEDLKRYRPDDYARTCKIMHHHPTGVSHLSAHAQRDDGGPSPRSSHIMRDVHDMHYLAHYPPLMLGRFAAIELANPLDEQLDIMSTILRLLGLL